MTPADLLLLLLGGGFITAIAAAWIWIDRTVKVTKEAGSVEEKLRQAQEALDALKKAREAEIAIERNMLDPERLRDDDGHRRD